MNPKSRLAQSYQITPSTPAPITKPSLPSAIILAKVEINKVLDALGISPTVAACVLAIGGVGIVNIDSIVQKFENDSQIRHQAQIAAMETDRMEALQLSLSDREVIAESRYEKNPTPVIPVNICKPVAVESGTRLDCPDAPTVAIIEGKPVIDPNTLQPIPTGSLIADLTGNTAIIMSNKDNVPVATQIARTGNRKVIDAWWQRQKAIYGDSIQKPSNPAL